MTAPPDTRPQLFDVLPEADLAAAVADGRVRRRTHPELPLSIYTYTSICQYRQAWNPATITCRGLIVDDNTREVVAKPFPKFFGIQEHGNGFDHAPPLPDEPFEVFDKLDGSLGIVFEYAGRWHAATKGAFESEQAKWAQKWLDARDTQGLRPGTTYLTEIIYPENRIVVRHDTSTLVLLGAYGPDGSELPLADVAATWRTLGGGVVTARLVPSVAELAALARENRDTDGSAVIGSDIEGWVVRFASGLRVKVKTADYVRLHGILTRTTPRTVWEALSNGIDPAEMLGAVPDEFRTWVEDVATDLRTRYATWTAAARADFDALTEYKGDRGAFARQVRTSPYRAALFRLFDGRSIDELAWKEIRPEHTVAVPDET